MTTATMTEVKTMEAVAISRFGGVETLSVQTRPIPEVGDSDVLIEVEAAGLGVWDAFEREGEFDRLFGTVTTFPHILGSEGAGWVKAVGSSVKKFKPGDRVYAMRLLNPKGGFYARYAVLEEEHVSLVPPKLRTVEAAVMGIDAITAVQGLESVLDLKRGERVMIFGAGGGIGHLAVQIAKHIGARVFAVASGPDGVALARELGADDAIDGLSQDVAARARNFAPNGLDAALLTAGGEAAEKALAAMRQGGRVAYPNGVRSAPQSREGLSIKSYNGTPDARAIAKLNNLIESGPFRVHVARSFRLDEAADAHRALGTHYLGKLAILPG